MYAELEGPQDAPDLVCLHGAVGTGRYHWSKQVKMLAQRFRLHLADLPGHGHSPAPDDVAYSRDLHVAALTEYLEQRDGPSHVAGFSMGGHTALALVGNRPELFASVVLVGVSVRRHPGMEGWRQLFQPDTLEATYPLWVRQLAKLHAPLGEDAWRDVCVRDSSGLEVDVDVAALGVYRAPALLVRGDRDHVVGPGHYEELRNVWEQADELVVPRGAHDVQLTRSAIVRPALADFYEEVLRSTA